MLVTGLGGYGTTVEYLVVAGGGGGGLGSDFVSYQSGGGGGGAGGLLVSPGFPGVPTSQNQGTAMAVSAGPTSYTIQVGGGGVYAYSDPSAGPTKGGGKGGELCYIWSRHNNYYLQRWRWWCWCSCSCCWW